MNLFPHGTDRLVHLIYAHSFHNSSYVSLSIFVTTNSIVQF
jgi:hypothetical protein